MKRTIKTALRIWRQQCTKQGKFNLYSSLVWPAVLILRVITCTIRRVPRGLIVEPSQNCTGACSGCALPEKPSQLEPSLFREWLRSSPSKPVTIHFSGKHSDPLASSELKALAKTAQKNCSVFSISTIGLAWKPVYTKLPVDRWIFSIPAATEESWSKLRGSNRFAEVLEAIRAVKENSEALVEVVLTLWKASANDVDAFFSLAEKESWQFTQVVFGRFDPEGNHFGRLDNIETANKNSPYTRGEGFKLKLKNTPLGCPLLDYLFLDAEGALRPCPFTGDEAPILTDPCLKSWKKALKWREMKRKRSFPACSWCP